MSHKKGEIIEVHITDFAFGGMGVGRLPGENAGLVVFVKDAAPGDTVRARITKSKKSFIEAQSVEIVTPSPERVAARCKHFGVCGGCSLQFLPYEAQLKWKQKIVVDAFRQIGGMGEIPCEPILGCETPWYYRNKMEYSFGSPMMLGLHPRKKFWEVFDVEECFLQSPETVDILKAVREWAKENNTGSLRTLTIREGKNTGERMVNLGVSGGFKESESFKEFIVSHFPKEVTSLYVTEVRAQKGHRTVITEKLLSGTPTLTEKLTVDGSELTFEILPQAFFQPNTKQAQVLYGSVIRAAKDLIGSESTGKVLDLYCGTGTIGMFFAAKGWHVVGIDSSSSAIENAKKNASTNNIKNMEFRVGDIDSQVQMLKRDATLIITDPPRAGISTKGLRSLMEFKIPHWIYVSCNPTTLARDIKILCEEGGYEVVGIQPVDMFPHTYHIETVCALRLKQPTMS